MKETAIIIPTFNSAEVTINTIKKLLEQTYQDFDIIVVDCGSEDWKRIKEVFIEDGRIYIVRCQKDLGGAGSFWLGTKIAYEMGYKYIILSDNDAIPISKDLIETLVSYLKKGNDPVVPKQAEAIGPTRNIRKIPMFPFHFFAFSKDKVKKYGLPPIEFFIWCDDVTYTKKISNLSITQICSKEYSHPPLSKRYYLLSKRGVYSLRNMMYYVHHLKKISARGAFFSLCYALFKRFLIAKFVKRPFRYIRRILHVLIIGIKKVFGKIYKEKYPYLFVEFELRGKKLSKKENLHIDVIICSDRRTLKLLKNIPKDVNIEFIYFSKMGFFQRIMGILSSAIVCFNKRIFMDDIQPVRAIFSKEIYLYNPENGEIILIENNPIFGVIYAIISLLLSIIFGIAVLILSNMYSYKKYIKKWYFNSILGTEYFIYHKGKIIDRKKFSEEDFYNYIDPYI